MILNAMVPMLAVADLGRTMRFYCDELGFKVANTSTRSGDPAIVWCMLRRDRVSLMFNGPGARIGDEPPGRPGDFQILYFYPDDVRALHAGWKAKGLPVTDLRVTTYCMREFELRDPDGYRLWFGEETTAAATVDEDFD